MKFKRYDPAVKAAFMAATRKAREEGKSWAETLEAAKSEGYKGTSGGLYQLSLHDKEAKGEVKAKRGRPRKVEAAVNVGDLSGLEAHIEKIVKERVKARLTEVLQQIQQSVGV